MTDLAVITPEEWERIERYIANGPAHVHLETNEDGTAVFFDGGVMHPRAYLQMMEGDYSNVMDIVETLPAADTMLRKEDVEKMPGSLGGQTVPRLK